MNRRRRIIRFIALTIGVLLCAVGVLHDVLNIRSVTRAVDRGEIARRLSGQVIANVAASGLALLMPGLFLLFIASDLGRGKRLAWRLAVVVGVFLFLIGIFGYWWEPIPHVLIFSALGVILAGPLVAWRKDFDTEEP